MNIEHEYQEYQRWMAFVDNACKRVMRETGSTELSAKDYKVIMAAQCSNFHEFSQKLKKSVKVRNGVIVGLSCLIIGNVAFVLFHKN